MPQVILDNHYKVELFFFLILKEFSLSSVIVVYKLQFLLKLDLTKILEAYSSFFSEAFVVYQFLIYTSLLLCFILDLLVFTSFNTPVNPDLPAVANAGAAVEAVVIPGVIVYSKILDSDTALSEKAISTEINPGPVEDVARRQQELQGFISETKEGNQIGSAVKSAAGHPPFTYPDSKIQMSKNIEYLQKGLKTKAEAATAEFLTGLKCISVEEQGAPTEEEIDRVIKHLESLGEKKEETNSSVIAQVFPEFYKGKEPSDGQTP